MRLIRLVVTIAAVVLLFLLFRDVPIVRVAKNSSMDIAEYVKNGHLDSRKVTAEDKALVVTPDGKLTNLSWYLLIILSVHGAVIGATRRHE